MVTRQFELLANPSNRPSSMHCPPEAPRAPAPSRLVAIAVALLATLPFAAESQDTFSAALTPLFETTARTGTPPIPRHGGHGQFSKYLIDPLFTHHAILEDELRFTTVADDTRDGERVWTTSVEVAYALTDAFGFEVFIPYTQGSEAGIGTSGIGDIELQVLKWSFLRRENLIMTTALGGIVPVGDEGYHVTF